MTIYDDHFTDIDMEKVHVIPDHLLHLKWHATRYTRSLTTDNFRVKPTCNIDEESSFIEKKFILERQRLVHVLYEASAGWFRPGMYHIQTNEEWNPVLREVENAKEDAWGYDMTLPERIIVDSPEAGRREADKILEERRLRHELCAARYEVNKQPAIDI